MTEPSAQDRTLDLSRLRGRLALLVGGSGGIGESIGRGLAAAHAKVTSAVRNELWAVAAMRSQGTDGSYTSAARFDGHDVDEVLVIRVGLSGQEPLFEVTEASFELLDAASLKATLSPAHAAVLSLASAVRVIVTRQSFYVDGGLTATQ
jgi:NAD(P)-dependent dehydrogenase (short-subunit alcohol dehydrogenase family)